MHNVIAPNFGDLNARLDEMEAPARTGKVAAFKVYTAWGPNGAGFSLEDPAIGLPVIQKAHDLGVKVIVAHKGLPLVRFDAAHNTPDDIVAVSRQFPDMQFVVFHGAWDKNHIEGAVRPGLAPAASTPSCARSTSPACRRTATYGWISARCGERCSARRPWPRTPSASS